VRHVIVYKSVKVADMYLFVDQQEDLERVPPTLLARFGRPVEAMRIELTPERRLARSEALAVLEAISIRGFYLQMPPVIDAPMSGKERE
jgi:uncharacterized protein YcgL (UPF0745 family)